MPTFILEDIKKVAPDFTFTSVQINVDLAAKPHVDGGNLGRRPYSLWALTQVERTGQLMAMGQSLTMSTTDGYLLMDAYRM